MPAAHVARWDGASWSALGSGVNDEVHDFAVFDDGSGAALYAGGDFTIAGGVAANRVARWDGSTWSALGGGTNGAVFALAAYDDGGGSALHAGGAFTTAFDSGDSFLAKWGCAGSGTTFCFGEASACPCGNGGVQGRGCDNAQATGGVSLALVAQSSARNGATLAGAGFPVTGTTALVIRSSLLDPAAPVVFGDGLRCISTTTLVRLAAVVTPSSTSTHTVGHGAAGPGDFYYQLWYRSTPSTFCDPLAAFNLSNGVRITW